MVFSSIPPYLDPSNWHQHQIGGSSSSANHNSQLPPPVPPPPPQPHGGSIRPGSMAERARMANIPLPETALKCPRCESTNTKFCYFNNYSLSQPRHFCKACRRYWTRGGALRSVPVGGGCRRNKKSKSTSRSKSPASSVDRQNNHNLGGGTAAAISTNGGGGSATSLLGLTPPQFPPLRFMSSLSHLTAENFSSAADAGLSYSGITATGANEANNNFHSGSTDFLAGGVASLLSGGGGGGVNNEMWRLPQIQQFPFLGGNLEPSGIYQFIHHGGDDHQSTPFITGPSHQVRPKLSSGLMKMEDHPELNLSRQLLGGMPGGNHEQQWNTSTAPAWTDLSSFTSSSTSNPL